MKQTAGRGHQVTVLTYLKITMTGMMTTLREETPPYET